MIGEHTRSIKAAHYDAIPRPKRLTKLRNTVFGLFMIVLGITLPVLVPEYPLWIGMLMIGLGAYSMSAELVTGFAKLLPAAIRDIYSALKGNGNG
jgi:hypothetical protein